MTSQPGHRPLAGLDDAFGPRARALRKLQARLLDLYEQAGYEEIIPPLVERPESLSSGAGRFLVDQTLVFSDPADTGLLAIRPDMTPQIARIAATRLRDMNELRLCYSGPVLMARPEAHGSRQQWQTGVELMGVNGDEADVEIMHLAAMSLHAAGFDAPLLQVGHMGLIRALVKESALSLEKWTSLLARRSPADMKVRLDQEGMPEQVGRALLDMAAGRADRAWLESVRDRLGSGFSGAAGMLLSLVEALEKRLSGEVQVRLDAAVMPRFLYHNGIVFTGFALGAARALLHGGRYDAMMASHGRDLPATGFSFDLWSWLDARP